MKKTWRDRATIINTIPSDKYIMFIDESGTGNKNFLTRFYDNADTKKFDLRNDVFLLNGVILSGRDHKILSGKLAKIKKLITNDGCFDYKKHGYLPINLHNTEIERKEPPFNNLDNNFFKKLNHTILTTRYNQIIVGINYYLYVQDNEINDKTNPLLMTLGILVTNYAKYLEENELEGIIVFEEENKIQDNLKLKYILRLIRYGTRKNDKSVYKWIKGVYFRKKWTKCKDNIIRTCASLELVDLTISPTRRLFHPEFITIESKLLNYPNYGRNAINIIK